MEAEIFCYPILIKEVYLDSFGHMNNAMYLTLFEEARWEMITQHHFGVDRIKETGLGPTILEAKIRYLKELTLRDEIIIETQLLSYERKIGKLQQKMKRAGEDCCVAEFTFALFDLKQRKLVPPTPEWLIAVGVKSP